MRGEEKKRFALIARMRERESSARCASEFFPLLFVHAYAFVYEVLLFVLLKVRGELREKSRYAAQKHCKTHANAPTHYKNRVHN